MKQIPLPVVIVLVLLAVGIIVAPIAFLVCKAKKSAPPSGLPSR